MADYFVPATISAENILVFLLLLALAVTTTWFAAHYYLLKRDFAFLAQKMANECAEKIDEERKRIQRIPYHLAQINQLVNEIRACCSSAQAMPPKDSEDKNPEDEDFENPENS